MEMKKWRKADPQWGVIHRGRTYLFATQAEQQRFLANPDRYAPVLSGYDPVVYADQKQLVEGKREFGVFLHDRIYLFQSETNLQQFVQFKDRYVAVVRQAMQLPPNRR